MRNQSTSAKLFGRKVATKVSEDNDDNSVSVKYHYTDVVKFNPQKIFLNSGGWMTSTTKRRMNEVSKKFGLGYNVYQRDYKWYVDHNGKTIPFQDNMELQR